MTNEVAIKAMTKYMPKGNDSVSLVLREAMNMGIKALEQIPDLKDAYDKGYKDGQEAIAFHYKLCKEEGSVIIVSEDATNGDVIKAMFPNAKIIINECLGVHGTVYFEYDKIITFYPLDWWNSPYRKEQE